MNYRNRKAMEVDHSKQLEPYRKKIDEIDGRILKQFQLETCEDETTLQQQSEEVSNLEGLEATFLENISKLLKKYRKKIKDVGHFSYLIQERNEVSKKIATYKKEHGLPVRVFNRELELINDRKNQSELSPAFVSKLFELIMAQSRDVQERLFAELESA